MTLNQLASKIARREGKAHQVHIGDVREVLGILADMIHETTLEEIGGPRDPMAALNEAGARRAARKKLKE